MKLDDTLLQRLRALFTAEAQELLETINRHLLTLEKQPNSPQAGQLMAEVFRAAHTLKGSARSVNAEDIGALAHTLETLFDRVQKHELQPDAKLFDRVYQALDAMSALVQEIATGQKAGVDVAGLSALLASLGEGQAARPVEPPPRVEPPAPVKAEASVADDLRQLTVPETKMSRAEEPAVPSMPHVPSAFEETVRVAVDKLDSLLAQVGELQVTRIGAEQRRVEVRSALEHIEEWENRWRKVRSTYRNLLLSFDESLSVSAQTSLAQPRSLALQRAQPQTGALAQQLREWDTLLEFLGTNDVQLRDTRVRLNDLLRSLEADSRRLALVTQDLQEDVRRTRMMPASVVFDAFPRMVRDLARELEKDVRLLVEGSETEMDRSVLEQIKAPLIHLLRNSIDHGIETQAARAAAGKPLEGMILLRASQRGDSVFIEVADDGGGIDPARIKASALKKGLLTAEAAAAMNNREATWLIFTSGFSTRAVVTDLSGRGVGLDVVRENVERLQGTIDVDSQIGQGTRFLLRLPLTVATTLCLLVQTAEQIFALPISNVDRIVPVRPGDIGHAQGREAIRVDGRPVVVVRLTDVLAIEPKISPAVAAASKRPAIILGSAERRVAFLVDSVVTTQAMVIKSLPHPLDRVRHVAGATILGTGQVAMILNVADLLRSAVRPSLRPARPAALLAPPSAASAAASRARPEAATVLVVDDSITTRTLEKNILESAGYRVQVAADGLEAWTLLQSVSCNLLVLDIQMPRMDGFELTAKIRADERFKHLPVILVTALAAREDRERGIAAGADAYIVKSAFDQDNLLKTIRQLI